MSNKFIKYNKLYNILKESIEWENAEDLNLKTNTFSTFTIDGYKVEVIVENFPEDKKDFFPKNSIIYNNFNPKTYYNFGFSIEGQTTQQYVTNYKVLAKILGILVKSLFTWIKQNSPDVITIIPEGKNERENRKKLSIYGSILQGNEAELKSMGYMFDGIMGTKYLTIKKFN
jgi:hypothetical protein